MQVKGLMPQESDIARKHPPAEPLGEMWYGITFSAVPKYVMLRDSFIGIAIWQKNRECSMTVIVNRSFPILCFYLRYYGDFSSPLHPLVRAIVTWRLWDRQEKCYKIVTFDFRYPYVHRMANFALWSLNYSMVKSSYVRAISIISKSIVNF